jgi:hypothetical protein
LKIIDLGSLIPRAATRLMELLVRGWMSNPSEGQTGVDRRQHHGLAGDGGVSSSCRWLLM